MSKRLAKIVIILLNWNGKKDTLECLASLTHMTYPNFQILIVDNGSKDDSVAVLRQAHPHIPILETGTNLGFAGGNNVGIEWALRHHAEWIFLLNNDTITAPDCLDALMRAAQEQPRAKILGAKILRYHQPDIVDHLGGFWNPQIGEFESPDAGHPDHPYYPMREVDYVCGAALFMHRSVPETIGLLEPKFFLFWEESDFCYRAKRAGLQVWTAPEAKVWHKVSSSFTGGKPHMHYFWWRSRLLWIERNCTPDEKKRLFRTVIAPEIAKLVRHYLLKTCANLFASSEKRQAHARRLKAGCTGIFHYYRRQFGNCPDWILSNKP
ncbi:MAG: glycosyltransferase family 2 protein [Verrucomicrobia bacterium]|nr:glycosyltransferase family 2 protein [Verrucomicrobiota bacterium]MBU6445881.1 glycosyltransferase family 2 protein [Verrucomicrobiota bacterium]